MLALVRSRSWLLAPAVAATAALALAAPATAATGSAASQAGRGGASLATAAVDPQGVAVAQRSRNTLFKVRSAKLKNGGAISKGTLKWKNKRAVEVVGRINDLCPGDGQPARVNITPIHSKGSNLYRSFIDDTGCEENAVKFRTVFEGRRVIKRILVEVCEQDSNTAGGLVAVYDCRTKAYGNPHRG